MSTSTLARTRTTATTSRGVWKSSTSSLARTPGEGDGRKIGCFKVTFIGVYNCSRAHAIYGVTIPGNVTCAASGRCEGDPKDIPKNCKRFTELGGRSGSNVQMGYRSGDPEPGMYILEEAKKTPYCLQP